jgi:16S rRNA (uracil1498-N3)-methyltransferase
MMDMIVRRAVELGAAAIVPVVAARSQRIPEDRAARRTAHWRQIAIAACEQCGRNRIPPIADLQPLAQWLDTPTAFGRDVVMLVPQASDAFAALVRVAVPRAVLIGPEGGFIAEEVELAVRLGVRCAQLGPRVLRAETAALAALATIDAAAAGRAGLTPRPIDATIRSR